MVYSNVHVHHLRPVERVLVRVAVLRHRFPTALTSELRQPCPFASPYAGALFSTQTPTHMGTVLIRALLLNTLCAYALNEGLDF